MPLGTRTLSFLFTDIEGSTALWETRPDEMSSALRRHDEILRQSIGGAGGTVFKTGGDAFYAMFPSAPAAIRAAVDIQNRLATVSWSGPALHVRVAIHSGEVEERDNDYFGPTLNAVARLLSAGHGDQILLSATTCALVREQLDPGVDILPMGAHRLKDLRQPMEIFQVVRSGLRSRFPALRTLSARANNLPAQLASFIGREEDLAGASALLRTSRLVTMTGAGGSGKTRLALQVAAGCLDEFRHGLWFVDLAPVADPEGVPSATATALGLYPDPARPVIEALTEYFAAKEILLILDNCEHLVSGCATLADVLLCSCPDVRVLATSREPLALRGEAVMAVGTLAVPPIPRSPSGAANAIADYEAVRLFVERASACAPSFRLTDQNAAAVAEICARLDGIPLAIELAAARTRVLAPAQIVERLADRFALLVGGSRSATPRQQTLLGTIAWSYQLLSPQEQALFRRLSVFAGGWTLEAAEAACSRGGGDTQDLLDLMSSLVDRSLVIFEAEPVPRFRFLETIRQFAADRLEATRETDSTRAAHLEWFTSFAEQLAPEYWSHGSVSAHASAAIEHHNLLAALGRAVDLETPHLARLVTSLLWFWQVQGHVGEGNRWAHTAIQRPAYAGAELQAAVLDAAGWLASVCGEHAEAERLFDASVEAARLASNARTLVAALWGSGTFLTRRDPERARLQLEESLALNSDFGHNDAEAQWREVALFNSLGMAAISGGHETDAESNFRKAVEKARRYRLRAVAAAPLGALGEIARARGDWERAAEYYEEGQEIWREMGADGMLPTALLNLGYVARHRGDVRLATTRLHEAFELERRTGSAYVTWFVLGALAGVLLLARRPEDGAHILGAAQAHQDPPDPTDRIEQMRDERELTAALGIEPFQSAFGAGQGMSAEDALRLAEELFEQLLG
jgi:predicted ATPase/class 3 adenylate cyclase